jgi:hypothetical protein
MPYLLGRYIADRLKKAHAQYCIDLNLPVDFLTSGDLGYSGQRAYWATIAKPLLERHANLATFSTLRELPDVKQFMGEEKAAGWFRDVRRALRMKSNSEINAVFKTVTGKGNIDSWIAGSNLERDEESSEDLKEVKVLEFIQRDDVKRFVYMMLHKLSPAHVNNIGFHPPILFRLEVLKRLKEAYEESQENPIKESAAKDLLEDIAVAADLVNEKGLRAFNNRLPTTHKIVSKEDSIDPQASIYSSGELKAKAQVWAGGADCGLKAVLEKMLTYAPGVEWPYAPHTAGTVRQVEHLAAMFSSSREGREIASAIAGMPIEDPQHVHHLLRRTFKGFIGSHEELPSEAGIPELIAPLLGKVDGATFDQYVFLAVYARQRYIDVDAWSPDIEREDGPMDLGFIPPVIRSTTIAKANRDVVENAIRQSAGNCNASKLLNYVGYSSIPDEIERDAFDTEGVFNKVLQCLSYSPKWKLLANLMQRQDGLGDSGGEIYEQLMSFTELPSETWEEIDRMASLQDYAPLLSHDVAYYQIIDRYRASYEYGATKKILRNSSFSELKRELIIRLRDELIAKNKVDSVEHAILMAALHIHRRMPELFVEGIDSSLIYGQDGQSISIITNVRVLESLVPGSTFGVALPEIHARLAQLRSWVDSPGRESVKASMEKIVEVAESDAVRIWAKLWNYSDPEDIKSVLGSVDTQVNKTTGILKPLPRRFTYIDRELRKREVDPDGYYQTWYAGITLEKAKVDNRGAFIDGISAFDINDSEGEQYSAEELTEQWKNDYKKAVIEREAMAVPLAAALLTGLEMNILRELDSSQKVVLFGATPEGRNKGVLAAIGIPEVGDRLYAFKYYMEVRLNNGTYYIRVYWKGGASETRRSATYNGLLKAGKVVSGCGSGKMHPFDEEGTAWRIAKELAKHMWTTPMLQEGMRLARGTTTWERAKEKDLESLKSVVPFLVPFYDCFSLIDEAFDAEAEDGLRGGGEVALDVAGCAADGFGPAAKAGTGLFQGAKRSLGHAKTVDLLTYSRTPVGGSPVLTSFKKFDPDSPARVLKEIPGSEISLLSGKLKAVPVNADDSLPSRKILLAKSRLSRSQRKWSRKENLIISKLSGGFTQYHSTTPQALHVTRTGEVIVPKNAQVGRTLGPDGQWVLTVNGRDYHPTQKGYWKRADKLETVPGMSCAAASRTARSDDAPMTCRSGILRTSNPCAQANTPTVGTFLPNKMAFAPWFADTSVTGAKPRIAYTTKGKEYPDVVFPVNGKYRAQNEGRAASVIKSLGTEEKIGAPWLLGPTAPKAEVQCEILFQERFAARFRLTDVDSNLQGVTVETGGVIIQAKSGDVYLVTEYDGIFYSAVMLPGFKAQQGSTVKLSKMLEQGEIIPGSVDEELQTIYIGLRNSAIASKSFGIEAIYHLRNEYMKFAKKEHVHVMNHFDPETSAVDALLFDRRSRWYTLEGKGGKSIYSEVSGMSAAQKDEALIHLNAIFSRSDDGIPDAMEYMGINESGRNIFFARKEDRVYVSSSSMDTGAGPLSIFSKGENRVKIGKYTYINVDNIVDDVSIVASGRPAPLPPVVDTETVRRRNPEDGTKAISYMDPEYKVMLAMKEQGDDLDNLFSVGKIEVCDSCPVVFEPVFRSGNNQAFSLFYAQPNQGAARSGDGFASSLRHKTEGDRSLSTRLIDGGGSVSLRLGPLTGEEARMKVIQFEGEAIHVMPLDLTKDGNLCYAIYQRSPGSLGVFHHSNQYILKDKTGFSRIDASEIEAMANEQSIFDMSYWKHKLSQDEQARAATMGANFWPNYEKIRVQNPSAGTSSAVPRDGRNLNVVVTSVGPKLLEDLRAIKASDETQLVFYRGMSHEEAEAILAWQNNGKLESFIDAGCNGLSGSALSRYIKDGKLLMPVGITSRNARKVTHFGDVSQARKYVTRPGTRMLGFRFKPGAKNLLSDPRYIALSTSSSKGVAALMALQGLNKATDAANAKVAKALEVFEEAQKAHVLARSALVQASSKGVGVEAARNGLAQAKEAERKAKAEYKSARKEAEASRKYVKVVTGKEATNIAEELPGDCIFQSGNKAEGNAEGYLGVKDENAGDFSWVVGGNDPSAAIFTLLVDEVFEVVELKGPARLNKRSAPNESWWHIDSPPSKRARIEASSQNDDD